MAGLVKFLLAYMFLIGAAKSHAALSHNINGYGTIGVGYLNDDSVNESDGVPHNLFDRGVQYDVDSRFGIQGTVAHDNGLGFTGQLVALSSEDYDVDLEWSYLHFNYANNLTIRAGRLRRPLYLHSDYRRIGYIYPWARLPAEIYSDDIRFASSIDGLDIIYQFNVSQWDFNAEIYYGGTSGRDITFGEGYTTRDDYGLVLDVGNGLVFFRLGYHRSPRVEIEPLESTQALFDGLTFAGFSEVASDLSISDLDVEFYDFATGITYGSWFVNAEIVNYRTGGGLIPDDASWYINGGKRFGRFTTHISFSERRRRIKDTFSPPIHAQIEQLTPLAGNPVVDATIAGLTGLAQGVKSAVDDVKSKHQSYTLGLRYDFNKPMSLKFEYQQIHDKDNKLRNDLFSVTFDFIFGGSK